MTDLPVPPAGVLLPALLAWYDAARRELPWRAAPGRTADPYHVLLSEIMLQQTTAATVMRRFDAFLRRFPTLDTLADAPVEAVLHAWQGLGYYRRARSLHECARTVARRHGGVIPGAETELLALPGIGPYTAAAIRAIAYGQPAVPLDGNVQRVLARLFGIETPLPAAGRALRVGAASLGSGDRPGDVAQALMDLGALICRPRRPKCGICPWQAFCRAHRLGIAESLPRQAPKRARPLRRGLAFLLRRSDGAILFRRRPEAGLLGGLHELPSTPWSERPLELDRALEHAPQDASWRIDPTPVRHVFTHFVLELALAEGRTETPGAGLWCRPGQLHSLALPTVMKKLLRQAGELEPTPRPAGHNT